MTKTYLWVTFLAVTLMTGLLVGSIPTSDAAPPCPPTGKFVEIEIVPGPPVGLMGPFEINSYTYTSTSDGMGGTMGTFMFTHEVDSDLSGKIDDAIKSGDEVKIHFSVCKAKGKSFKQTTVWLSGGIMTEVTETAGDDDDFPTEKASGTFTMKDRMTTSSDG